MNSYCHIVVVTCPLLRRTCLFTSLQLPLNVNGLISQRREIRIKQQTNSLAVFVPLAVQGMNLAQVAVYRSVSIVDTPVDSS